MALFGGSAPSAGSYDWQRALQIIAASLQDAGASYQGRPGTALSSLATETKRLGDQKKYQDTVSGLFGAQNINNVQPTAQMPMQGAGAELANRQAAGAYEQPLYSGAGGMFGDAQAQMLASTLPGIDPSAGYNVLFGAMQGAQDRSDRKGERAQDRQQKLDDQATAQRLAQMRPVTAQERQALGISGNAPAIVDGNGKVTILDDPNMITAYQQEMLKRQRAADAENARHNRAQEASGREGEGGLFSMIDTTQGMYGVTRGGQVQPMKGPDGKPLVSYHSDTGLRYDMSAAQAGGRAGGTMAEALPTVEASFREINKTLDSFNSPEVKSQAGRSLGFMDSKMPTIPGYNSNFNNRLAQLQGQTFLQAFNSLRGSGAITEMEGEKATNSIARLNRASTEKEFYDALNDARATFANLQGGVRQRAQRGAVVPQMGSSQSQQAPNRPSVSNW